MAIDPAVKDHNAAKDAAFRSLETLLSGPLGLGRSLRLEEEQYQAHADGFAYIVLRLKTDTQTSWEELDEFFIRRANQLETYRRLLARARTQLALVNKELDRFPVTLPPMFLDLETLRALITELQMLEL